MKKLLLAFVLVVMLFARASADVGFTVDIEYVTPTPSPAHEPIPIRNGLILGSTLDDIISAEGREPDSLSESMAVYFKALALSQDADIMYNFDENGLVRECFIILRNTHYSPEEYVKDFDSADDALSSKYGSPTIDRYIIWSNDLYSSLSSALGSCLVLGYASLYSVWELDGLEIQHHSYGIDTKVTHAIVYKDPTYVKIQSTPDPNSLGI